MNFSGCARLVKLARNVDGDPASIGVLSTGEACVLLCRLDRLNDSYKYPLAALRGSSRSGKRRCVIFIARDGGNDRARPQKIGIDYEGATCPACPFWAGRDRWTGTRLH